MGLVSYDYAMDRERFVPVIPNNAILPAKSARSFGTAGSTDHLVAKIAETDDADGERWNLLRALPSSGNWWRISDGDMGVWPKSKDEKRARCGVKTRSASLRSNIPLPRCKGDLSMGSNTVGFHLTDLLYVPSL